MRNIFSVHLDCTDAAGKRVVFVMQLDRNGDSQHIRPLALKRGVDLRPGDVFQHTGKHYRIVSMKAYRDAQVTEEQLATMLLDVVRRN